MSIAADSAALGFFEQIVADIQDDRLELPGFPEAVLRIQRTLQYPDASVDDVVKILSSEPALAAQALRIANSVMFRARDGEITDLRTAVNRLGFNLVRSIAVAFAIQHLRLGETYSPAARAEIETIWRDSLNTASICFVIAKHCTHVNADQALLAGLLHVLGRLYLVMRAETAEAAHQAQQAVSAGADATVQNAEPAGDNAAAQNSGSAGDNAESAGTDSDETQPAPRTLQALIGAAILKEWGLSEKLQHAVEQQDNLDYEGAEVSVTDVLIAAKVLGPGATTESVDCPVLERIAAVRNRSPRGVMTEHTDEIRALRSSLGA